MFENHVWYILFSVGIKLEASKINNEVVRCKYSGQFNFLPISTNEISIYGAINNIDKRKILYRQRLTFTQNHFVLFLSFRFSLPSNLFCMDFNLFSFLNNWPYTFFVVIFQILLILTFPYILIPSSTPCFLYNLFFC